MQYYLNGFKPGDPTDASGQAKWPVTPPLVDLPAEVDVLIVGCGPAGLTLAAQLAAFPDISTRIVEQKSGPLQVGQADGISGRSSEIFQAFGFADRVMKEAYYLKTITFWKHDAEDPSKIVRSTKKPDGRDVYSEFPHVVLNQARVHEFLLDTMRKSPSNLEPDYCRQLLSLNIETGTESHPVTATLERVDATRQGKQEVVKAHYVVGCDGARSIVRKEIGVTSRGDSANKAWGVMDLLVVTDFPDIRIKSIIQSASEGYLLIIPREGGHLVRFYIEIDGLKESERVSSDEITSELLIAAAKRILHPYTLEVKDIAWWSVYKIGQRVCDKFDNVADAEIDTHQPNVFIAGDACHTHSPKAGQGMNVSIHDSFNLGWKLASVIRGHSSPRILHTYSAERQEIAEQLIEFDRQLAKMFSVAAESAEKAGEGVSDPTELQKYMVRHDGYVSGTMSEYAPSLICGEPTHQHLAIGFEVGKRFHSSPVIRLADARPVHLGHVIEADGRWRLFIFANSDDPAEHSSALHKVAQFFDESPESPVRKYTPQNQDVDSIIETLVVLQRGYREVEFSSLPGFLWPVKGQLGLRDYEKVFCPDHDTGEDIFDTREIDRKNGCMIVVRPDQHIADIQPLDGCQNVATFFDGFMVPARV